MHTDDTVKNIYICSSARSGSTLLDLLLGSHSQIESLGEINQLSKNISLNSVCTCGTPVRSCRLWKEVIKELNRKLNINIFENPYSLNIGYPNPIRVKDDIHKSIRYNLERKVLKGGKLIALTYNLFFLDRLFYKLNQGLKNTILLYETVREKSHCKIVVDSSKTYIEAIGIYRLQPKNTRIILLSRDGRGVLNSKLKSQIPLKKAVKGWINHYKRSLELFNRYIDNQHILFLKYEDVAIDPSKMLTKVCDFIGVDFEEEMIDFSRHLHHIANGNEMRFIKNSTIKLDNCWKDELPEKSRLYFEQKAMKINTLLGYY